MAVLTNLVGPLYEAESRNQMHRRLVNWYVEENLPGNEYPYIWNPTPGTSTFVDTGKMEVRALHEKAEVLYIVADNTVYSCDKYGTLTTLGLMQTFSGHVRVAEGADELLFVDGDHGYTYQITDNNFSIISDETFPRFTRAVAFQDGYFIAVDPNTQHFFTSDIDNARSWSALGFASKGTYGDVLNAVFSWNAYLWLFGSATTEIWNINAQASASSFPFVRQTGTMLEVGCAAPLGIARAGGTFFWISRSQNGGYFIAQAQGFAPKIVSNRSIAVKLNQMTRIDDCYTWSYIDHSHEFVLFNFPTDKKTFVYDLSNAQWHERDYRTPQGKHEHHIGQSHAFFNGMNLVASRINGKVLKLQTDVYSDNDGDHIRRLAVMGPLEKDVNPVTVNNLQVMCDPGVGALSGQGNDPTLVLRSSKDFGNNWSNIQTASPGKLGEYRDRCMFRRIGTGRSITLELSATDPVKWAIKGARADIHVGNS